MATPNDVEMSAAQFKSWIELAIRQQKWSTACGMLADAFVSMHSEMEAMKARIVKLEEEKKNG